MAVDPDARRDGGRGHRRHGREARHAIAHVRPTLDQPGECRCPAVLDRTIEHLGLQRIDDGEDELLRGHLGTRRHRSTRRPSYLRLPPASDPAKSSAPRARATPASASENGSRPSGARPPRLRSTAYARTATASTPARNAGLSRKEKSVWLKSMPMSPRARAPASSGGRNGRTPVAPASPAPLPMSRKRLIQSRREGAVRAFAPGTLKGVMTIDDGPRGTDPRAPGESDRGTGDRGEIRRMGRPRSTTRDLERYAGL